MTIYQIVSHVIKKTVKQIKKDNEEQRVIYRDLDGVPLISLLQYVPLNASSDVSDTAERQLNREILWVFKDGEPSKKYSKIAKVVLSAFTNIIDKLLGDSCEYTLVFIPASDRETTEKRWRKFSRELASALDCENGFRHLRHERDSVPRHFIGGRGRVRPLDVDEEFFDGKQVILIDDLVNTGKTMKDAIRHLRNAGAEVVCCLSLATT